MDTVLSQNESLHEIKNFPTLIIEYIDEVRINSESACFLIPESYSHRRHNGIQQETTGHGRPGDNGRQQETTGDNTTEDNGRQRETMGDNGRQRQLPTWDGVIPSLDGNYTLAKKDPKQES